MTDRETLEQPGSAKQVGDETLVADARDGMWPAEMVQQRLSEMQGDPPLPASQVAASFQGRRPLVAEDRVGDSESPR